MGTAGHGFPVVWREDAGFVSGWAALPWNSRAAQSSPGAPGIALSQQSRGELRYSGHCCSAGISLGSGITPGIWPLLPAMSLCPACRRALGHPGVGVEVSQKVFPLPFPSLFPPCQQPGTNWASWECCPCPPFQARLRPWNPARGGPQLSAAESHGCFSSWEMFPACSPLCHSSSASSGIVSLSPLGSRVRRLEEIPPWHPPGSKSHRELWAHQLLL